jgi:hypothetical protein
MLHENLPEAMISEEEEKASGGAMKAGCNLPIWHNGELIGSIGITGDPDRTEPLTRLASGLFSKELREREMLEERTRLLEKLHQAQKMESLGIPSGLDGIRWRPSQQVKRYCLDYSMMHFPISSFWTRTCPA